MIKTSHTIPIILAAFLLSCTGKSNGQPQQSTEKAVVEQPHTAKQQRLAPPLGYEKVKLTAVHSAHSLEAYHSNLLGATYIIIMVASNSEIMQVRL